MKTDSCRSCGAAIVWTLTQKGKRMPVDAEPVSNGKFVLEDEEDDEKRRAVYIGEKGGYGGERYSSHFGTCPHAAEHSGHPRNEARAEGACRPDGHGFCATHPPCDMMRVLVDALRREVEKR